MSILTSPFRSSCCDSDTLLGQEVQKIEVSPKTNWGGQTRRSHFIRLPEDFALCCTCKERCRPFLA